ncbi:MAG TPA: hypothetical protein VEB23_13685, partial [Ramlibacter sp.]|nr:hypothetical protein [Ramlibacter sp.]
MSREIIFTFRPNEYGYASFYRYRGNFGTYSRARVSTIVTKLTHPSNHSPESTMTQEIYLDANATSPVMPAAIDAALA